MKYEFKWQRRWVPAGKELMEFFESRFPFEGDRLITGLVARIQRSELDPEESEAHGADELYFPALDIELLHGLRICVRGGFRSEPWQAPWGSSISVEDWEAVSSGDAEKLAALQAQKNSHPEHNAHSSKHLCPEGEYEFEGAEDVVRDFIREIVSCIREDAAEIQHALGGDVLSVTEVAEVFGVPRNTVLNWIKTGSLRAFRLGSKWMIERKDLASAVEESKTRNTAQEASATTVTEGPQNE
jgi:excisionase family DNA binding protein